MGFEKKCQVVKKTFKIFIYDCYKTAYVLYIALYYIPIECSAVKLCMFLKIRYAEEKLRKSHLKLKFHLCSIPPAQKWILQVHFSNAFNSICRGKMFYEVRSHIPPVAVWMESCYCLQPVLFLGGHCIMNCYIWNATR